MSNGDSFEFEPQAVTRSASACRWAVPTLSRDAPEWLEAESAPWTCVKDAEAKVLESTEPCETCPHWEARRHAAEPADARESTSEQAQGAGAVPSTDWFAAGPKPHENS